MKKFFILFFLPCFLYAELILEITKGTDDPYKVAIVQFNGEEKLSSEIHGIIINNLKRSGEFKVFTSSELLSIPSKESEIISSFNYMFRYFNNLWLFSYRPRRQLSATPTSKSNRSI